MEIFSEINIKRVLGSDVKELSVKCYNNTKKKKKKRANNGNNLFR